LRGHAPDGDRLVREALLEVPRRRGVEALARLLPAPDLGEEWRDARVHQVVVGILLQDLRVPGDGLANAPAAARLVGGVEHGGAVVSLLAPEHAGPLYNLFHAAHRHRGDRLDRRVLGAGAEAVPPGAAHPGRGRRSARAGA